MKSATDAFEDAEIAREEARAREKAEDEASERDYAALVEIIYESGAFALSAAKHTSTYELASFIQHAGFSRQSPASTTAADAWDEGHQHCFHVENPNNPIKGNPYRVAAPEGDGGND